MTQKVRVPIVLIIGITLSFTCLTIIAISSKPFKRRCQYGTLNAPVHHYGNDNYVSSGNQTEFDERDVDMLKPADLLALKFGIGTVDGNFTSHIRYLRHIRALMTRAPKLTGNPNRRSRPRLQRARLHYSQFNQSRIVDQLLKTRRNGFFVECGANDGEWFSNSLFFELHRNWTGLLIESDTTSYSRLLQKNRNVYTFGGCLSPTGQPQMMPFTTKFLYGSTASLWPAWLSRSTFGASITPIFCVPLNDLLTAIGRDRIDYLSLDIEGAEPEVLENLDWNKVRIDVMTVEYTLKHSLDRLRRTVLGTGLYREVQLIPPVDVVFARKDLH